MNLGNSFAQWSISEMLVFEDNGESVFKLENFFEERKSQSNGNNYWKCKKQGVKNVKFKRWTIANFLTLGTYLPFNEKHCNYLRATTRTYVQYSIYKCSNNIIRNAK